MGLERTTSVFVGKKGYECVVLLEAHSLICRGGLKRSWPLAELKHAAVRQGRIEFESGGERIAVELGDRAASWLDRIQNPRSRLQKLGVTATMSVCVLGAAEPDALAELLDALDAPPKKRLTAAADLVLCFWRDPEKLSALANIASKLADRGAVWVLWPKGRKDFAHEHVVAAARHAGLSSTRSMGFSAELTGLRFVRAKK